ncbi:MAG: High-affinity branched-chain amino acid transport system permease protein LivH, partial [uncultured Propionibacteriaceae bacterium]
GRSPAARERPVSWSFVRLDRGGLHRRLRHRPAHQLRPWRDLHDRRVRGASRLAAVSGGQRVDLDAASDALWGRGGRGRRRPVDGAVRLPTAPQRTTSGAADHRYRGVDLSAGAHPFVLRRHSGLSRLQAGDPVPADRVRHRPGVQHGRSDHPAGGALHPRSTGHLRRSAVRLREQDPARPRDAGHVAGSGHRAADGHQRRQDHHGRVRPGRRACRRGRSRPRSALHQRGLQDGVPGGAQSVHRCCPGRHREHQRRCPRWSGARCGRGDGDVHPRSVRRLRLEGRVGVRTAHLGARLQTAGSAGSEGGGPSM